MEEGISFYINQRPVSIEFDCPHCGAMWVKIPWNEVDVPEYWGDDWGSVTCPYCQKEVKLGEYEMD